LKGEGKISRRDGRGYKAGWREGVRGRDEVGMRREGVEGRREARSVGGIEGRAYETEERRERGTY